MAKAQSPEPFRLLSLWEITDLENAGLKVPLRPILDFGDLLPAEKQVCPAVKGQVTAQQQPSYFLSPRYVFAPT
jgi:hypothetical protein